MTARTFGLMANAVGLVATLLAACAVRLPGDNADDGEGFPCAQAMECPQPDDACLLAYCMEQQCVHVPAPEGQLPQEEQVAGDCQLRYCDGNGSVTDYPATHDVPADDDNPCTEERCQGTEPEHHPKAAGTGCGKEGICNGAGKCGVCKPDAAECQGHAVRSCSAAGQWSAPKHCVAAEPVCSQARCVALVGLAVGSHHACARFDDGSVRCWGAGGQGQLGRGGPAAARPPVWGTGFRAADVGARHACALDGNHGVWCWGANDFGQLGDGSYQSTTGPVRTPLAAAQTVAVGAAHSCALTAAGQVHCWGRNDRGQLGSGKAPRERFGPTGGRSSGGPGQGQPQPIAGLSGAAELVVDEQLSCVRSGGQPLRCWGATSFPQPEPSDDAAELKKLEKASLTSPTQVSELPPIQQLAAGEAFSCGLGRDGSVHCWGAGDRGQLGTGATQDRFKPAPVAGLKSVRRIALGDAFGCALTQAGQVSCWGANDQGQLGNGKQGPGLKASPVAGLTAVKELHAGAAFACALQTGGPLVCWGAGDRGQLGNGSTSGAPRPVTVTW